MQCHINKGETRLLNYLSNKFDAIGLRRFNQADSIRRVSEILPRQRFRVENWDINQLYPSCLACGVVVLLVRKLIVKLNQFYV